MKQKRRTQRRRLGIGGGVLALLLLVGYGLIIALLNGQPLPTERTTAAPTELPALPSPTATFAPQPTLIAQPADRPHAYPPLPAGLPQATVVHIVDGDTVDVEVNGQRERVRLIGIDTPEVVAPGRPVMCYGREASEHAAALLLGQTVLLEEDRSQDSRDRFGRMLRYLWLPDGRMANLEMIADGFAYEYTFRDAYAYQAIFREAEATARRTARGLWAPETCAGQAIPAGTTPIPTPTVIGANPLEPSLAGCRADSNAERAPNYPVLIVTIDKIAETATLRNVSDTPHDLADWTLCSIRGSQTHTPLTGVLAPGEERVFPNGGSNIWSNNDRDDGALYDPQGRLVSYWFDEG
jgi:micrococcal nuclease